MFHRSRSVRCLTIDILHAENRRKKRTQVKYMEFYVSVFSKQKELQTFLLCLALYFDFPAGIYDKTKPVLLFVLLTLIRVRVRVTWPQDDVIKVIMLIS